MNPLELAYVCNEKVNASDIISLIPYLVDKGYIKIEFPFQEDLSKVSNFKLIKRKEYDGNNALESYLLSRLFEKSDVITYYELCNNIEYKALFNFCTDTVNTDRNYKIIFKDTFKKVKKAVNLIIIIGLFIYDCLFSMNYIFMYFIQLLILTAIAASMNGSDIGVSIKNGPTNLKKNNFSTMLMLIVVLLIFSIPFLIEDQTTTYTVMKTAKESILYLLGIVIFAIISVLKKHIKKRNTYGKELYQKIIGFKDFLKVTPRESIEVEFNKNKDCYFDIFSYCFVLGMSDKCTTEYDKFFNNVWNLLYTATDMKNNNQSDLQSIKIIQEYNKNLEIESEKFIKMLQSNDYVFLGKQLQSSDIETSSNTKSEKFSIKYIFTILKNWILNS